MSKYEYDIIIFFPNEDDESSETYQWAQEFSRYLDTMLSSLLDYRPTILLSPDITSREKILKISRKDILAKSALYLFLINNQSLQNEQYQSDVNDILDFLNTENKNVLNKILKVELEPTLEEEQNKLLQQVFTHDFYEINQFSKKAKTIEITYGASPGENFWTKLLDISSDVVKTLNVSKTNIQESKPTIFLAQSTIDQVENYDTIKRELQHQGYEVIPNNKLPNKANRVKEILDTMLPNCVASVHIIGKQYGNYVTNADVSLTELQSKLVNEHTEKSDLKKIVFIPKDNRPADGKQNLFIERLKKEKADNSELIVGKPTEFLEILLDALQVKSAITSDSQPAKFGFTYLITDIEPDNISSKIKTNSIQEDKLITLKFSNNISKNLISHQNNLKIADNVIIYHESENELWLQSQLQDIRKIIGLGKQSHFRNQFIITKNNNIQVHPFLLENFKIVDIDANWQEEISKYWNSDTER